MSSSAAAALGRMARGGYAESGHFRRDRQKRQNQMITQPAPARIAGRKKETMKLIEAESTGGTK